MYPRKKWFDHVVERPRTVRTVRNEDGSFTYDPEPGDVFQQGTQMSATNYNNIEGALVQVHAAYDLFACITQAKMRAMKEGTV